MKALLIILSIFGGSFFTEWQPDFETAKKMAVQKNQLILLNFSGSDWCGPCIRMKKEYFYNEVFSVMADSQLVLLNADFPRSKKINCQKSSSNKMKPLQKYTIPKENFLIPYC